MAITTIKIIIAEGSHDAAFIARVMKSNGYFDPETKINKIEPPFLRDYIINFFKEISFNRSLKTINYRLLPSAMLIQEIGDDKEMAIIFASHGLNNSKNICRVLEFFVGLKNNPYGSEQLGDVKQIKVILNFDADNDGVSSRIDYVNTCIKTLTDNKFPGLQSYGREEYKGLLWGAFISGNEQGFGALEEFVLPLFEDKRFELVKSVDQFIQCETSYDIPQTSKANEKKTRIGIMGQLDMPGVSNTVLIDQSKMISDETLRQGVYEKVGTYIREF